VAHDVGNAADGARDRGTSGRHRLEEAHGHAFRVRRQDEDGTDAQQLRARPGADPFRELHARSEAELGGTPAHRFQVAVAGANEARARNLHDGVEQVEDSCVELVHG